MMAKKQKGWLERILFRGINIFFASYLSSCDYQPRYVPLAAEEKPIFQEDFAEEIPVPSYSLTHYQFLPREGELEGAEEPAHEVLEAIPEFPAPPEQPSCSFEQETEQKTVACGLNERGTQLEERIRFCEGSMQSNWTVWYPVGECNDSDECIYTAVETEYGCTLNGRGSQERTCIEGNWSEWSSCLPEEECLDGLVENEERSIACGLNLRGESSQEKKRECITGYWTAWSAWEDLGSCYDPDDCSDDTIDSRSCGLNLRSIQYRECSLGQWNAWENCQGDNICADTAVETEYGCTLNGRGSQERTCIEGNWSEWSSCVPEEECIDGLSESEERSIVCGFNSRGLQQQGRTRTCSEGFWGVWTAWEDTNVCADVDSCGDGSQREVNCGTLGVRTEICVAGQYVSGDCICPENYEWDGQECSATVRTCEDYFTQENCENTPDCLWTSSAGNCVAPQPCEDATQGSECWNLAGCYFNDTMATCLSSCGNFTTQEPCLRERCVWENLEEICVDLCSTIDLAKACREIAGCFWDEEMYQCFDDGIPVCSGNERYSLSPVDEAWIDYIISLGSTGSHTLPSSHLYFRHERTLPRTEIKAPATLFITSIDSARHVEREDLEDSYSIVFQMCENLLGYFKHVVELSPELELLYQPRNCRLQDVPGEGMIEYCSDAFPGYQVASGTILGTVGTENFPVFDFGTRDFRTSLNYVNPPRYGERAKSVVCPLDYYPEESRVREILYEKISRVGEPRCGEVMQDVPGTLQGNWFFADGRYEGDESKQLGFLIDHWDTSARTISVGGIFTNKTRWVFFPNPDPENRINKNFSAVADTNVYCYEDARSAEGRIMVQLQENTSELLIEYQGELTCTDGEFAFITPTPYAR